MKSISTAKFNINKHLENLNRPNGLELHTINTKLRPYTVQHIMYVQYVRTHTFVIVYSDEITSG